LQANHSVLYSNLRLSSCFKSIHKYAYTHYFAPCIVI
jgi:hypothetical protein